LKNICCYYKNNYIFTIEYVGFDLQARRLDFNTTEAEFPPSGG